MTENKEIENKRDDGYIHEKAKMLDEAGCSEAAIFVEPSYMDALVGYTDEGCAVYNRNLMTECLMDEDETSFEEAEEWIEYNTMRTVPYMGEHKPVIMRMFDDNDPLFACDTYEYQMNAEDLAERAVAWVRDWFAQNGPNANAVIAMSGGKDSNVAAMLCVKALGRDRVIGVAMPDNLQGLNGADEVAKWLGIRFMIIPIAATMNAMKNVGSATSNFPHDCDGWSEQAVQNMPPRIRMALSYAVAQTFNGRPSCNCNLSERRIGYETLFGDQVGSFAPLADMTVAEVKAVGHALGMPPEWVDKVPDDGLPNSCPDEEKFGFSYADLDTLIRYGMETDKVSDDVKQKVNSMVMANAFKSRLVRIPKFNTGFRCLI